MLWSLAQIILAQKVLPQPLNEIETSVCLVVTST